MWGQLRVCSSAKQEVAVGQLPLALIRNQLRAGHAQRLEERRNPAGSNRADDHVAGALGC